MSGQLVLTGQIIQARYKEQDIASYKHNPYIEALPEIYDVKGAASRISRKPTYDSKERLLPDPYRIHSIWSMSDFIKTIPKHITLEQSISIAIRQGYKARNPIKAEWIRQMRESFENIDWTNEEYEPLIRSTATGFALIGLSGIGKSTAIESVLGLYPQVIEHKEYNGTILKRSQLVWLKIECPFNGSIKGLCLNYFYKIDCILGTTTLYKQFNKRNINNDVLVTEMGHIAAIYGIGILVIDEIQRLSEAKAGGAKMMMNFFVKLINNIGLPVILVGTPKVQFIFDDLATTRRNEGFGSELWLNYSKDDVWDNFIEALWKYQWTNVTSKLTPAIEKAIYDCTQGIPDFAVKLYMLTQWRLIGEDSEKITAGLIREVFNENFRLSKPILTAIKNNQLEKLRNVRDIPTPDIKKAFQQSVQKTALRSEETVASQKEDVEMSSAIKIINMLLESGIENVEIAKECAEHAASKMNSKHDFIEALHFASEEAKKMEEIYQTKIQVEEKSREEKTFPKKEKIRNEEIKQLLNEDKEKSEDYLNNQ
ncbi:AAA family ATPase [Salipaludibacillus sp. CF4.18]|uniref:ATP-binding protein n=1 Tax=Salipaludibacillus sp. CF4.18 TaxID=3373081 RepID=UPI003EE7B954